MENQPMQMKIVLVGDEVSGKTYITSTYTNDAPPPEYAPTIFDTSSKTVKVNNQLVQLTICDTAGRQMYKKFSPIAYSDADIFLIVFSVADPASFQHAKDKWYSEVSAACPGAMKVFVGNKVDLRNASSQLGQFVDKDTARTQIRNQFDCSYVECSALTREGIADVFNKAIGNQQGIRSSQRMSSKRVTAQGDKKQPSKKRKRDNRGQDECCIIM